MKKNVIYICLVSNEFFLENYFKKIISFEKYFFIRFKIYKNLIEKIPIPRIINSVNFFGSNFYINNNTFIPQKETELLVKATLDYFNYFWKNNKKNIANIEKKI